MNIAEAAIAHEILHWAEEKLIYVPADRAVKLARRILFDASDLRNMKAAEILRTGKRDRDWRPVFGDYIKRNSPTMRTLPQQQAAREALDAINTTLREEVAEDARIACDRGNRRREAVLATRAKQTGVHQ